jgi:hypothetical protein
MPGSWMSGSGTQRPGLLASYPTSASQAGSSTWTMTDWDCSTPSPALRSHSGWAAPPCCGDRLDALWMPLESAQLMTGGVRPSSQADTQLARRATAVMAIGARAARLAQTGVRQDQQSAATQTPPGGSKRTRVHQTFHYDARPPWTDPDAWWYLRRMRTQSHYGCRTHRWPDHPHCRHTPTANRDR